MTTSRLIVKVRYRKPGGKTGDQSATRGYVHYIGTREGAVAMTVDNGDAPATKSQKTMADAIVKAMPETANAPAYEMYKQYGDIETADNFISDALSKDGAVNKVGLSGYAHYMATRPMANHLANTGLFGEPANDEQDARELDLKEIEDELSAYTGNVYLPIISLRGDDSVALGYDNPQAWRDLIERHRDDFCRWFKIPPENLRWVAAYHNAQNAEGEVHNHIHMIVWSKDPHDGWCSDKAIENMKETLAKDIFAGELNEIYAAKTKLRDDAKDEAKAKVHELMLDVQQTPGTNQNLLAMEMVALAHGLRSHKGRLYYRYLFRDNKLMVNHVVDELAESDPRLKEILDAWADTKDRQVKIYSDGSYIMPPLSKIKDFNSIKNNVVTNAWEISKQLNEDGELTDEDVLDALNSESKLGQQVMRSIVRLSGDLARRADHSAGYSKARGHQRQQMSEQDLEQMYASQIKM